MEIVANDYEQSSAMHYCKVCGKGFACGEALGGHMRAHDLVGAHNYEDPPFEEDKISEGNNKHSYFLRNSANPFLSCKAREACDKMSLTWPDHDENGKCTTNEMVSPISWAPPPFKYGDNDESCASSQEEEELANCLVMLSSTPLVFPTNKEEEKLVSKGGFQCKGCKKVFNSHQALGGHRASHKNVKGCFASSFDNLTDDEEGMNMNDEFLSPSTKNHYNSNNHYSYSEAAWCKKDGPVLEAARRTPWDFHPKRKEKLHECSICFRVFSSGQALGGHKRCHWLSSNNVQEKQDEKPKLVFKKPMIRKREEVDLSFSLTSNNLAHDEADSRAFVPKRPRESGDAMGNFSNEEESKKEKVEKLKDLKSIDLDGESSTWLQVGIASST